MYFDTLNGSLEKKLDAAAKQFKKKRIWYQSLNPSFEKVLVNLSFTCMNIIKCLKPHNLFLSTESFHAASHSLDHNQL